MKPVKSVQMTFIQYDLNEIVGKDHDLRKVEAMIPFGEIIKGFQSSSSQVGRDGYGVEIGMKCLYLQFRYDLSDREMEDRLRYDIAFRWFCKFSISDTTPDHSFFCRTRKAIGTKNIGLFFDAINEKAKDKKIIRGVFHFADSSAIKAKESTWRERDKAKLAGEEKVNNSNIGDYSADKDARFGNKGRGKFWFGYKRHQCVDAASGLVEKVAVTPANVSDADGLKRVCPKEGMVLSDKAYSTQDAQNTMKANYCHSGAIMKNNMKGKNKQKDKWLTKLRSPFENTFSRLQKKSRYRGITKNQMQVFLEAIDFNIKRLLVIQSAKYFTKLF
ncbi:MAG: transposase [Leptospiraceae bacterium]|nr:transposase [Leptospiraceae bacterium]